MNDSRRALSNERNEEVHVIDEGVIVGAGQVFGLMFVSSCSVVIHVDETILHTGHVTQILWQVTGAERVVPVLWRSCEGWKCILCQQLGGAERSSFYQ